MNTQTDKRTLKNGLILSLFVLGAVIGFNLVTVSVWGDYEASMIGLTYMGEKQLNTLTCPILATARDKAEVSVEIHNPLEHNLTRTVLVLVSSGRLSLLREDRVSFQLKPDESRELNWPVEPEDAVYGKLVLAKVYLFPSHSIPSKDATCGILVLDMPFLSGQQVVYGSLGLSMIGMAAGILLWQRNNKLKDRQQQELSRSMFMMASAITVGLAASLLGSRLAYGWLLGGSCLVVAVLLLVVTLYQMLK